MTFEEARAAFPILERVTYLNAGSFGPLARETVHAMQTRWAVDLDRGRCGSEYYEGTQALRQAVRDRLARLLQVPPEQVALTQSTTDACQIVLGGLRLGPHDEVVTTEHEHFGLLGPLHASGARVVVASPTKESILAAVGRHTRLLALSHVLWTTGQVLPVRALRETTGLPILVDGAQSVGTMPVDATGLDYYTISGQKWLCGPEGTGALVVADPEALPVGRPSYLSQQSHEPDGTFEPKPGAARFDPNLTPHALLAGLRAALRAQPDWRFERAANMAERCRELLRGAGADVVIPEQRATLVSWRVPVEESAEVVARLAEAGVIVRDLPGRGLVRASVGWWTSDDDLERLVATL
jgi:L-cysteine/cystine lyase